MLPTLFVHIGAGKTGTSFLQAQLALHHEVLSKNNVYYPVWPGLLNRIKKGEVTSGNIEDLLPWLVPRHPSVIRQAKTGDDCQKASVKWMESTITKANGRDILLSGEALQHARSPEISQLVHQADQHGYEIRIIFYVRHAIEHAISDYREHVQRGFRDGYDNKELRTIEGWLKNKRVPYEHTLQNYAQVLPQNKIIVRSYDADKKDLWIHFLNTLGQPPQDVIKISENTAINRSLTVIETKFLEAAAGILTQDRLHAIGMKMIKEPPIRARGIEPKAFVIDQDVLRHFEAKHRDIVAKINETWLKDAGTPLHVIPPGFVNSDIEVRPRQLLDLAIYLLSKQT